MNAFAAWGRLVNRRPWPVLAGSLLALVAVAASGFALAGQTNDETTAKPESVRASDLVRSQVKGGTSSGATFLVVFRSERYTAGDAAYADQVAASLAGLKGDLRVRSVVTPFDLPPAAAAQAISRDRHGVLAVVTTRDSFQTARRYYADLAAEVAAEPGLQHWATGNLGVGHDFDTYLASDLQRAESTSLPLSLVLLLLVFGTVVAALLPIGVGGAAVVAGIAATLLLARFTHVSQYSLNIVTLIGLGVAIDYSLFIVSRFRDELHAGASAAVALETTLATAGRAVAFSGVTVAIGLAGMLFFPGTFLVSMGLAGSFVVALAVIFALTLLPAVLRLLGGRIERIRVPMPRGGAGLWRGFAKRVMRRPLLVLIPTGLVLLLAASPVLAIKIANGDERMLPPNAPSRGGLDHLNRDFPGQDQNTFGVVVHFRDGTGLNRERVAEVRDLAQRLAGYPNVIRVDSVVTLDPNLTTAQYQDLLAGGEAGLPDAARGLYEQSVGRDVVVLFVRTNKPTQSDQAFSLLTKIRATPAPADADLLVYGGTAFNRDFIDLVLSHMPVAVLFVVVVTYLVMFLLVGSLLLPLKAVLTNLLSISASFGAVTWVFQQGHLSGVLNFTPQPIDPVLLVIMFCILFGLSMDYEVMLLSRIQEEWRRTGDNVLAVAEGLERSGRLITGAAAIMVAVFLSFALAQVLIIKAIGLGLALAVLIDATLMRMLLVPAVMRLVGRANWWAPAPLARLHQRLGLAERHGAATPAAAEPT